MNISVIFNTKNWIRLLCILALVPLLMQCKEDNPFGLSLAVNSDTIRLDTAAGKTHIMIYSDGDWKVNFKEDSDADWISVNRLEGHGNGEIVFSYSKNYSASRSVTLVLTKGGENKEILIIQNGIDVDMHFINSKVTIPKQALPIDLPVLTKIKGDYKSVHIEYLYDDETMEKWITNDTLDKEGYSFDALENNSGRDRAVRVYLSVYDADGKEHSTFVDITQTLKPAFLKSKYQATTALTKAVQIDTIILDGNVGTAFPAIDISVSYDQGDNWIEDVSLAKDSLLIIAVRENNSGANRNADIHLDLTINGQNFVSMTHHILQSKSEYEEQDFLGLRNMITSTTGTITLNAPLKAIEGIVISDAGNPNMETNPHISYSSIDMKETYKTAYVESLDGQYGFRLKFASQNENTLERYSKVVISINGLTLSKEADPDRYTISGLTSGNIVENEQGSISDVVDKQKNIAELTDNDVYTYVTLKDVSLSVPYGTYMNVNHGYVAKSNWNTKGRPLTGVYADAIPTAVYDSNGDDMNMLINTAAPMAINVKNKNSGTISGIVTHSQLLRFGGGEGDIGKYQIRPVNEDDIQLDQAPVATTLVEWNWLSGGTAICSGGSGGESAFVGTGFISCTASGASPSLGNDYLCNNPNSKAPYKTAFQYTGVRWWNAAEQRGEGFVLNFSTTGISAQSLLLNFSIQSGGGNDNTNKIPTYWQIEYSTDGTNYTVIPNSTFAVRPVVQWATNRPYESVGLMPYTFKLPNSILGQSDVYVKIAAQSDIYALGSPDGADKGHLTGTESGSVRLGNVSVKYIQ